MQGPSEDDGSEFPYAWLYKNDELADVCLTVDFYSTQPAQTAVNFSGVCPAAQSSSANNKATIETAKAHVNTPRAGTEHVAEVVIESEDADCLEEDTAPATVCSTLFTRQYLLHSQMLGSNSAFFRASITTHLGVSNKRAGTATSMIRWQLSATLCSDDAEAVEAVLFSMYKLQEYGDDSSSEMLVSIIKVADLWQANKTAAAASRALSTRTTTFPLLAIYSLPEGLTTAAALSDVMTAARKVMLLRFGDARSIIDSPLLLQQFLSLPCAAVQALLESSELATDAEASVLLLFSSWCDTEQGRACSRSQHLQLNGAIRYSRLSIPYLTEPEFCESLKSPQLTKRQLMGLVFARSLGKHALRNAFKTGRLVGPSGWYLPRRPPSPAHLATTLTLELSAADIKYLLAGCGDSTFRSSRASPRQYFAGFLWVLRVQVQDGRLCWGVSAEGISSLQALQAGALLRQGVSCRLGVQIKQGQPPIVFLRDSEQCVAGAGLGASLANCSPQPGELHDCLSSEWWAPHIINGCVTISADISQVEV